MDVAKLKEPSADSPLLRQLIRQLLADIEVVSNVKAASIGGSEIARLKSRGNPPPGRPDNTLVNLKAAYEGAGNHWDRMGVITKAQATLRKLRRGPELAERRGTKQWKLAIAMDTRASALVGADFGISASRVRQLRGELRRGL